MKQLLLTVLLALIVSTGTALATDDAAGNSYKPYTCEQNEFGVETCYCAGRYDCNYMISDGVCDVPMPELGEHATGNDMVCDDNFGGVGEYVCECSAEVGTRPGTSRRPDTFDSTTENAPSERTNETVPSRRGRAPDSGSVTEGDVETEETPPQRTVRDHRH